MAMSLEAQYYSEGLMIDKTAVGILTAGDVVQVAGRAAIVPTGGLASGALGSFPVHGIAKIAAAAVVGSAGNVVWWNEDGDPYGGVAAGGACTTKGADGDFVIGSLAANLAATDGYALVLLNEFAPDQPYWPGMTYVTKSAGYSILITDFGSVFQVDTDTVILILPTWGTTMDGGRVIVQNVAADGAALISVSPIAADKIKGAGWAGVDDKDARNTKVTAKCGDFIELVGDGVDGWFINSKRGVWAAEP